MQRLMHIWRRRQARKGKAKEQAEPLLKKFNTTSGLLNRTLTLTRLKRKSNGLTQEQELEGCLVCEEEPCPQYPSEGKALEIFPNSEPQLSWTQDDCRQWIELYLRSKHNVSKQNARESAGKWFGCGRALFKANEGHWEKVVGGMSKVVWCELVAVEVAQEQRVERRATWGGHGHRTEVVGESSGDFSTEVEDEMAELPEADKLRKRLSVRLKRTASVSGYTDISAEYHMEKVFFGKEKI